MAEKFNNKYRIESARLKNWDYGWNANYFVTICTYKRIHYFGKIHDHIVELSEIGKIAHKFWIEIPNHFPFVELGEFVIMPNHVHGIITINKQHNNDETSVDAAVETPKLGVSTITDPGVSTITDPGVSTITDPGVSTITDPGVSTITDPGVSTITDPGVSSDIPIKSPSAKKNEKWKSGTLGVILNQYKRICTINARKINSRFEWQERFHDRIIRDEKGYSVVSKYIRDNPLNWEKDEFY
jgi:putative transposase